jgi:hypothetical protein
VPRFESSTFGSYASKWLMGMAVFELALAGVFVLVGLANPEARFGLLLTAAILGLVAIGLLAVGLRSRARAASARRVLSTGTAGSATITGLTQTGMFMNENPQVEMDLMVQVPGRPPYAAKRKQFVPLILLGRLSTGSPLSVRVDPADPSNVEIDWDTPLPVAATGGWWGAPAAGVPTAVSSGGETLQEVQTALGASGLQAEPAFAQADQAGYTVEQLRAHLRTNGLSGTATIDQLEDSGKVVRDDHLFTMQTTTNVPGHPPHQGRPSAALVPKDKVGRIHVGATLPVKVAPDNFDALMFEWDKI